MANILDYLSWRGDLSFSQDSFNDVDGLILAELSYLDFENGISTYPSTNKNTLEHAIDYLFSKVDKTKWVLGVILPQTIVKLANEAKKTNRFKKIKVSNYVNEIDMENQSQFSAMCYHISSNQIVISFRGTDDTLIGWQENLNMAYRFPVPAQEKAASYIDQIASLFPNQKLYIVGQSKGGNLAVYGAIYCNDKIKDKIEKVYSYDGQGFRTNHLDMEKYNLIKSKIYKVLPQNSVVGVIFDDYYGKRLVASSINKGVLQHDSFSWQVEQNKFVLFKGGLKHNSKKFNQELNEFLDSLTKQQINELAKNVYDFIIELNKKTLLEVQADALRFITYLNKIKYKNRKLFSKFIYIIAKNRLF